MQKLEPGSHRLLIDARAEPTPQQIERLRNLEPAKAVASRNGRSLKPDSAHLSCCTWHARRQRSWAAITAHLAQAMGDTQTAVRIGKAAIAHGQNLVFYSYPVHALPKYKPLRPPPEPALLLGLARQETEFNTATVSGAGAQGILQVMKDTAKHVCRDYKIKCNQKELVERRLLQHHDRVGLRRRPHGGVLGLLHSGHRQLQCRSRARAPVDPRVRRSAQAARSIRSTGSSASPIEETRRYVVKVLSNIQIYRARLGDEATALRLDQDLARAREASAAPKERKAATPTRPSPSDEQPATIGASGGPPATAKMRAVAAAGKS